MTKKQNIPELNQLLDFLANSPIDFGNALFALKKNQKVARTGWNGKGMWIKLTPANQYITGQGETVYNNAHIDMKTATGEMCIGWVASQSDMLAEDWVIIKEGK